MDANLMSPEALRELADKKEDFPVKEAFLKQDFYWIESNDSKLQKIVAEAEDYSRLDASKLASLKHQFSTLFTISVKKGTRFVCYIEDGRECWYDDTNFGIENMNGDWAKQHLNNIRAI